MAENVKLKINNLPESEFSSDKTIMEAADALNVNIPRLCYLKNINANSSCRLCVVEIGGIKPLKNSCTVTLGEVKPRDNSSIIVKTNTPRVKKSIVNTLQLMAGNHKFECWKCPREHNCEFLALLREFNIDNYIGESNDFSKKQAVYQESVSLVIDSSKCILCGRCIAACKKQAGTSVLNYNYRGSHVYVAPALNHPVDDAGCIYCGKCIQACPVGALAEHSNIEEVENYLDDPSIYTVVQIAPSVRVALGEEFGMPMGTNVEGKIYTALELLGFDQITDTNFGADLTIMEEGTEFIQRFKKTLKGEEVVLPLFTSCSPGWVKYLEINYPEMIPHLSSCKSPQNMQGALIKHHISKKLNIDVSKLKVISVMPCTSKKYEAAREELIVDGIRDVDISITTRELARLIKRKNIEFTKLKNGKVTSALAQYTGAGVIFGATGGVLEAALRTVKYLLEKELGYKDEYTIDFKKVRGAKNGIKEALIKIAGKEYLVAVVHGAVNVPEMMNRIKKGKKPYVFVEFMACTGGCVNGGGQPIVSSLVQSKVDCREIRAKGLYNIDKNMNLRRSHENEFVEKFYKEINDVPGGKIPHHWFHTHYSKKDKYQV